MLGLPKTTEINKQLPKKLIYNTFSMNTTAKDKFDADIKKLSIVNEVSPITTNLPMGKEVSAFYVVLITLRSGNFDEKNIIQITKLINQNMLFILQYDDKAKLAVYHKKLMQTDWQPIDDLHITLQGLTLDFVWQNIIVQIGGIKISQGRTLDEQLQIDEVRKKLIRDISSIENQAWSEKQPKRKFEFVQVLQKMKNELLELK